MKKQGVTKLIAILTMALLLLTMLVACAGEQGIKGEQGPQGEQGIQGEQGLPGKDGVDGEDGKDGADGKDGVTPTIEISDDGYWIINGVKTEYKAIGVDGDNGSDGKDGVDGENGADGKDGVDGENGKDGVGIESTVMDEKGNIIITYTDGTTEIIEHNWVYAYTLIAPTCTDTGIDFYSCVDCSLVRMVTTGDAPGHTEVTDVAVFPTCTETGLTEGKHCSVCNEVFVAQQKIDIIDCIETDLIVIEATKNADGVMYTECTMCGKRLTEETIPAIGSVGLAYTIDFDNKTCTITGIGDCGDSDVVIPRVIDGYSVTCICEYAFSNCTLLTSIEIPSSVKNIESSAFVGCTSLTSIVVDEKNTCYKSLDGNLYSKDGTKFIQYAIGKADSAFIIPDSVTSIGSSAFEGCTSLTNIEIPNSVTAIEAYTFFACTSLTSIEIPNSVTSIEFATFSYCTSLKSIGIPSSVTSIGQIAFSNCTSLTSIEIPDSVTRIKFGAFAGCTSLTNIVVDEKNTCYKSLDGNLYSKDGTKFIQYAIGKADSTFIIPDSVTSIESSAFEGCTSLTGIEIPNSVTSIAFTAFSNCSSLTSVIVDEENENYKSIDGNLYTEDGKLLIKYAIGKTDNSFIIPNSVTYIESDAFRGCTSLTTITIPDSVTTIGSSAFFGCTSLTTITIPDSVTTINPFACYDCTSLATINFEGTVEAWNAINKLSEWDYNTGSYTIYCTDGQIAKDGTVTYYSKGLKFTLNADGKSYSVSGIGTCTDADVVIPYTYNNLSVTSIGKSAFYYCESLTNVTIPDSVTSIGDSAFALCGSLLSVTIHENVTYIGKNAFQQCYDLTSITVDKNNKHYASIDGNLYSKDGKTFIQYAYGKSDSCFIIPNDVTNIGDDALYYCFIDSVSIPDSVTSIGDEAFYHCLFLDTIYYEGTVEQWNSISKATSWNTGAQSYTIYCADGTISKSGTVTYY